MDTANWHLRPIGAWISDMTRHAPYNRRAVLQQPVSLNPQLQAFEISCTTYILLRGLPVSQPIFLNTLLPRQPCDPRCRGARAAAWGEGVGRYRRGRGIGDGRSEATGGAGLPETGSGNRTANPRKSGPGGCFPLPYSIWKPGSALERRKDGARCRRLWTMRGIGRSWRPGRCACSANGATMA